jgi:hypothetical protein
MVGIVLLGLLSLREVLAGERLSAKGRVDFQAAKASPGNDRVAQVLNKATRQNFAGDREAWKT